MKIRVHGLWHLGLITATSLARIGHEVWISDESNDNLDNIFLGNFPIFEPMLKELFVQGVNSGNIKDARKKEYFDDIDICWVTIDTPIDSNDEADLEAVRESIFLVLSDLKDASIVIISSQVPVGFTRNLADESKSRYKKSFNFYVIPENLRLGKSFTSFFNPGFITIGSEDDQEIGILDEIYHGINYEKIITNLETAEMVKNSLNSFLALQITFMGEISQICEQTGADAHIVKKALMLDERVSPNSYLKPGLGFSGGTLARDVRYLEKLIDRDFNQSIIKNIYESNKKNNQWIIDNLLKNNLLRPELKFLIIGITYTLGTNVDRRSVFFELASFLEKNGISCDYIEENQLEAISNIKLRRTYEEELPHKEYDVLIVNKDIILDWSPIIKKSKILGNLTILDPFGFLIGKLGTKKDAIKYLTVGRR